MDLKMFHKVTIFLIKLEDVCADKFCIEIPTTILISHI